MAVSTDFALKGRTYALQIYLNCDLQVKCPDAQVRTYLSNRLGQFVAGIVACLFGLCICCLFLCHSLSVCLPFCLVCGFILSVSPLFTGLSSNLPEDSVRSAVFKIQFRCLMQNIPGNKEGDRLIFKITQMVFHSHVCMYVCACL